MTPQLLRRQPAGRHGEADRRDEFIARVEDGRGDAAHRVRALALVPPPAEAADLGQAAASSSFVVNVWSVYRRSSSDGQSASGVNARRTLPTPVQCKGARAPIFEYMRTGWTLSTLSR